MTVIGILVLISGRLVMLCSPQSLRRMQDAQTGELLIHDGWRVMPEYFIFYTLSINPPQTNLMSA